MITHIKCPQFWFAPIYLISSHTLFSLFLVVAAAAKSLQLWPILCDPIDSSPPGSPVPGILQARTLEWVTISFSNAWKWKVKVKLLSCVRPSATSWTAPTRLLCPWDFLGKNTGVCSWWWSSKNIIQKPGFWLLMHALGNCAINYYFPLLFSPLPFMMNPSLHCLPVLNWRTKLPFGFLCFSRDTPPMSFVGVSVKSQPWGKHWTIWVPLILLYSSILLEIWFILNFTWKKKRANFLDFFFLV